MVVRNGCLVTTNTHTFTPVGATYESYLPCSPSLSTLLFLVLTHLIFMLFRYSRIAQLLRILGLVFEGLALTFVLFEVGFVFQLPPLVYVV